MSKQKVLIVGATGETGSTVLDALIEDGSFDVTCFIRTASANKPAAQKLRDRGLKIVTGDLTGSIKDLVALVCGTDTIISTIYPESVGEQIPLVDAAVQAGVRRFVPCNFGTPSARGGIMDMRDRKEEVHDHMFRARLGYTIVDVGFWYETSFPRVPSGRFDYASAIPNLEVFAGGAAPNMLIGKRDVGRLTARIMKDERTLNKRVYAYADLLSQNELNAIVEEKTGEKLELTHVTADQVLANITAAREAFKANPAEPVNMYMMAMSQYANTKYVREDNTPENAEYLGYINGRELYPDFEWLSFGGFVDELLAGKVQKPYAHLSM
ncbi:Uu.00g019990.m01.CDS01 [Anthostomella pinea]|uniref:Uu.00g019990.m01.CDS01 n=1 Tax=Anthostomella pinea TaxID=933095 RepID=A0AAI8YQT2_9PEZI|nr:Uu.00g019990.m01.CDS01 [Anthostomella pinea]